MVFKRLTFCRASRIRVTSDVILPGEGGAQIITANIGEGSRRQSLRRSKSRTSIISSTFSLTSSLPPLDEFLPDPELKANFRRLSKLVLAGYGGASLLFFGISPSELYPESKTSSLASEKAKEEAKLADAIDASEAEAAGVSSLDDAKDHQYSWWDILIGKHDQEIFEKTVAGHGDKAKAKKLASSLKARAVIGKQHLMPRFWILTDYSREEIVLVLRGTMSLNEIAADLTCDPDWFEPARTPPPSDLDEPAAVPGFLRFPSKPPEYPPRAPGTRYHVHGGMLRLARAMGDVGKPVQVAVKEALYTNPGFGTQACFLTFFSECLTDLS